MGGWLRGGIVAGQAGKFQPCIHLNPRFPKRVSVRNMFSYLRWSKGGNSINLELYQDNLPSKANATSKLYHIGLKDYRGRFRLIIP